MRIGWATKRVLNRMEHHETNSRPRKNWIGSTEQSVSYDGVITCVWHNNQKHNPNPSVSIWQPGDVLGCLLQLNHSEEESHLTVTYYLNGKRIMANLALTSAKNAYFAAISLSTFQQCYVNFGQAEFKFPPTEVFFCTFHQSMINSHSNRWCPLCGNNWANVRFRSCDHWIICSVCATVLKECPESHFRQLQ